MPRESPTIRTLSGSAFVGRGRIGRGLTAGSPPPQVGLFPVAYTIGTDFRPADRSKSDGAIRWNHW